MTVRDEHAELRDAVERCKLGSQYRAPFYDPRPCYIPPPEPAKHNRRIYRLALFAAFFTGLGYSIGWWGLL